MPQDFAPGSTHGSSQGLRALRRYSAAMINCRAASAHVMICQYEQTVAVCFGQGAYAAHFAPLKMAAKGVKMRLPIYCKMRRRLEAHHYSVAGPVFSRHDASFSTGELPRRPNAAARLRLAEGCLHCRRILWVSN